MTGNASEGEKKNSDKEDLEETRHREPLRITWERISRNY
jgi:hypothetical protein